MHLPKFMIFGAYKLHKATNKKMLTLHLYVNSCYIGRIARSSLR